MVSLGHGETWIRVGERASLAIHFGGSLVLHPPALTPLAWCRQHPNTVSEHLSFILVAPSGVSPRELGLA